MWFSVAIIDNESTTPAKGYMEVGWDLEGVGERLVVVQACREGRGVHIVCAFILPSLTFVQCR